MCLQVRYFLVKILFKYFRIADKIGSFFGHKIFKINHENVFNGLTQEEIEEAQSPDIVIPFSLFIHGAQLDKQLDGIARFCQIKYLKSILSKRTGIKRAIAENPDIIKTPIKRPLFIVGLPRTGTTLLYSLLAQDKQFRSPMFWEIMVPYPPLHPSEDWRKSRRFEVTKRTLALRKSIGEADFDVSHELRPDLPEECLFILGRNFLFYHFFCRLDSFQGLGRWFYSLTQPEFADIYRFYKQQLQLIGYGGMRHQTYLLKAHVHLICLDAILDVFPDACFIFTYRPLTEIIPSFCSTAEMGTRGWGPYGVEFGKRIIRLVAEFANRGVRTMKRCETLPMEQQPFFNIEYEDLVKDPIGTVKQIYDKYGFTFTKETEESMKTYLANNKQHRHGKHDYSMSEYGLNEQDITDNFGSYLEYFKDKSKYKLI